MTSQKPAKPVNITGRIIAADFVRYDRVKEIMLETEDFQQYVIGHSRCSRQLFSLLLEEVIVAGCITGNDEYGRPIIQIQDFSLVDYSTLK